MCVFLYDCNVIYEFTRALYNIYMALMVLMLNF